MQRLSREMQLWLSLKSLQYKACNSEQRNDNLQSNPATLAMATNTQWEQNPALFPPLWPCQASCPPMVFPSSSYQSFLPKMSPNPPEPVSRYEQRNEPTICLSMDFCTSGALQQWRCVKERIFLLLHFLGKKQSYAGETILALGFYEEIQLQKVLLLTLSWSLVFLKY